MQTPRQRQSPEIEMKQIVKEFVDELSRVNNFELIFPSHEYSSISAFLPTQRPCIDLMMKALSSTPSNPGLMTTTGSDSLMRESLKTSPTKHSRPDGDRPPRTQRSGLTEEPKKQSPITRIHQGEERKIVTTNGASKQPELATTTSKEQDMQPISILFGAILRTDIIYKSALFSDHHKGHERSALRARMSAPNEESSTRFSIAKNMSLKQARMVFLAYLESTWKKLRELTDEVLENEEDISQLHETINVVERFLAKVNKRHAKISMTESVPLRAQKTAQQLQRFLREYQRITNRIEEDDRPAKPISSSPWLAILRSTKYEELEDMLRTYLS
eukprot:TRINITY_DN4572_c0_g1_i7.p1 TRINITY_DN4572_c0_g1~~TRINITY_DN4572_c0_g1_i7.p1  ORF type:complete len:331 (+),score=69.60 TRINITY_DN4572_c0_g1_i7:559-1551(+)